MSNFQVASVQSRGARRPLYLPSLELRPMMPNLTPGQPNLDDKCCARYERRAPSRDVCDNLVIGTATGCRSTR